jgi:uncharacterized protein YjiS (DUF1127 family)
MRHVLAPVLVAGFVANESFGRVGRSRRIGERGVIAPAGCVVPARPDVFDLQRAAHRARTAYLGVLAAAGWRSLVLAAAAGARALLDTTHVWHARIAQRRRERAVRVALGTLDTRTLRDLGLDRSEIGSVAAESAGRAEATRCRLRTAWTCPI